LGCDPGKLALAARLRSVTTLPIMGIEARVQIGTAKGTKSVLQHLAQSPDQRKPQKPSNPPPNSSFNLRLTLYRFLAAMKRSLGRMASRRNMTF
jgi:hypothetical protein